ncbi:formyltransferase family protein [Vibrio splendidus]|jgi:phosphoribosylglycinamide formyltransferase-1
MNKIVFLVSSNGGNVKFFDLAIKYNLVSKSDIYVIADRACGAVEYAKTNNIESMIINYSRDHDSELRKALLDINPDVVVSTWNKIIDEDTVKKYFGKIINVHYSLLPAFGGMIGVKPIEKALDLGCKYIGPTCHVVDEGVDTGRILSQSVFSTGNISFDEAVGEMFRRGCICLLEGINQVSKEPVTKNYDDKLLNQFNSEFWSELSVL